MCRTLEGSHEWWPCMLIPAHTACSAATSSTTTDIHSLQTYSSEAPSIQRPCIHAPPPSSTLTKQEPPHPTTHSPSKRETPPHPTTHSPSKRKKKIPPPKFLEPKQLDLRSTPRGRPSNQRDRQRAPAERTSYSQTGKAPSVWSGNPGSRTHRPRQRTGS